MYSFASLWYASTRFNFFCFYFYEKRFWKLRGNLGRKPNFKNPSTILEEHVSQKRLAVFFALRQRSSFEAVLDCKSVRFIFVPYKISNLKFNLRNTPIKAKQARTKKKRTIIIKQFTFVTRQTAWPSCVHRKDHWIQETEQRRQIFYLQLCLA